MFDDCDATKSSDHPTVQAFSQTMANIRGRKKDLATENKRIELRSQVLSHLSKRVSSRIERKTKEIADAEELDQEYEVNEDTIDQTLEEMGIAGQI